MTERLKRFLLALTAVLCVPLELPQAAVADAVRDAQWHLASLGVRDAQLISRGEGVAVAVIDTGVDASHPDLAGAIRTGSEVNGYGDGHSDSDGHGTAISGLVAARGRSTSAGALGIAPGAIVVPIKIPDQHSLTVADAIDQATAKGVKVICLALTTTGGPELEVSVQKALAADVLVVAGAGNLPDVGVQAPARYPGVIAAVGVDRNNRHADISVSGPEAVLAAPAVEIVSTAPGGSYSKLTGTSASTAIIAGVAALIRSRFPGLVATEVIRRMTATAIDEGDPGRDREYGFGIVNPVAALTAEIPPLLISPTPDPAKTSATGNLNASGSSGAGPVIGLVAFVVTLVGLAVGFVLLARRANR